MNSKTVVVYRIHGMWCVKKDDLLIFESEIRTEAIEFATRLAVKDSAFVVVEKDELRTIYRPTSESDSKFALEKDQQAAKSGS
ncbi:MAG TPA: hypothetical protein PKZ32_17195 [Candidatus Melainabacteria bacterium]|nr:hypothetical protein [Candidatus Melainabacteria bacterium]